MRITGCLPTCLGLALAVLSPGKVQALSPGEQEAGVTFEWTLLAESGWETSSDPGDFPLAIEGKTTDLLLGLTHRETGSQIFLIYGVSSKPVFLSSIPIEPPEEVLDYLQITRKASSSGELDPSVLSLGAIRWYITAPGDGRTFLPSDGTKAVSTFSARTILAFTLIPASGEPRHVTVTALLRCRAEVQERMMSDYDELLRTIRTVAPGSSLIRSDSYRDGVAIAAEVSVFEEMLALAQKYLPYVKAGTPLTLSSEELVTVRSFLDSTDPTDYFANILLASSKSGRGPALTEKARGLYLAYLEYCRESSKLLDQRRGATRYYSDRILEIDPEFPLALFPVDCQAGGHEGEEWRHPVDGRVYRCQEIANHINGSNEVEYFWVPHPLEDGVCVSQDGRWYRWIERLETWFPMKAEEGDRIIPLEGWTFQALGGTQDSITWVGISKMGRIGSGVPNDISDICPAGTKVLSGEIVSALGDSFRVFSLDQIRNHMEIDRVFVHSPGGNGLVATSNLADRVSSEGKIPKSVKKSVWARVCVLDDCVAN